MLYRVVEVLEGVEPSSSKKSRPARGRALRAAGAVVDVGIDRLVWYAGWTDKIAQASATSTSSGGLFFKRIGAEPTGVVGILAPQSSSLLGLISVVAPVVATGNTAVVVTSAARPLPAITLGEVLATSRPAWGRVVNLITAKTAEVARGRLAPGRQRGRPDRRRGC